MHALVLASPASLLCAGTGGDAQALADLITVPHPTGASANVPDLQAETAMALANRALHAPGQVNHCYIAWSVPTLKHAQAAALAVTAELMTHQLLHQAIREQGGAYGGSASYAGDAGIFGMSSYRDPRMAATYADFASTIDRVLDTDFSTEQIEEAIICVIKALDRPGSPYDNVLSAWNLRRRGVDAAARQRFRTGVLNCTQEEIKAAVRQWLKEGKPSRAAFAGNTEQDLAGLEVVDLLALSKEVAAE